MNKEKRVSEILKRILVVLMIISEQLTVIRLRTELIEKKVTEGGRPKRQKRGARNNKKDAPR